MKQVDKNSKIIRMVYVAFEKFYGYQDDSAKIGQMCFWSKQFQLPIGMSLSDACKVISFLSEKVEKENLVEEASLKSVMQVSAILKDYGFKLVEGTEGGNVHGHGNYPYFKKNISYCDKVEGVTDLITFGGQERQFKKSDLYSRYFNWFTEGVKEDEVKQIYKTSKMAVDDVRSL